MLKQSSVLKRLKLSSLKNKHGSLREDLIEFQKKKDFSAKLTSLLREAIEQIAYGDAAICLALFPEKEQQLMLGYANAHTRGARDGELFRMEGIESSLRWEVMKEYRRENNNFFQFSDVEKKYADFLVEKENFPPPEDGEGGFHNYRYAVLNEAENFKMIQLDLDVDLTGLYAPVSDFEKAHLFHTNLAESWLPMALFKDTTFESDNSFSLSWKDAHLQSADLQNCHVRNVLFEGTNFKQGQFYSTGFHASIFENVDFTGRRILGCNFSVCGFEDCIFEGTTFEETEFLGFRNQELPDFSGLTFQFSRSGGIYLSGGLVFERMIEQLEDAGGKVAFTD